MTGDFAKAQPGFVGSDGRFAKFETLRYGIAAADKLLKRYGEQSGINTMEGLINRWAPPHENNSSAYIEIVATKLRVEPTEPIELSDPGVRARLIDAMGEVENGRPIRD